MGDARKSSDEQIAREAAGWIARRDRGLAPVEQDDYLQWLREDPRRAAAIARHEETVRRLQSLRHWEPAGSSEPNPDLFARPRPRWRRGVAAGVLTGAIAAAWAVALWWRPPGPAPAQEPVAAASAFLRHNERQVLTDGSTVELRDGSRIEVRFTPQERRVRLTGGEAHFTVAKNPAWPFIVEAGQVAVRAVGTAFAVRFDAAEVDVVVTEGRVRLEPTEPPGGGPARPLPVLATAEIPASHRVLVSLAPAAPAPAVTPVSNEQMREALAWQAPRFQFFETPLAEAVAEFNRRNRAQIVLSDPALAEVPIGGTFRVDNVEGFVSLLELTLGVRAEKRGGAHVLGPAR